MNKTIKYPNKIWSCLKGIINDLKKSGAWKVQLIIAINFISSKDNDEKHSKSDNIEIMIIDKADEVTEEIVHFFRYIIALETSSSDFVLHSCITNVMK